MPPTYPDEQRFIPLISDYGFKVTFGNETNTLFLRQALQALIKSPIPITQVIFDKNTVEGYTSDSRSGVYDISCTDEQGNHFIVEMQLSDYPQFLQRMNRDGGPFLYGFQVQHAGREGQVLVRELTQCILHRHSQENYFSTHRRLSQRFNTT